MNSTRAALPGYVAAIQPPAKSPPASFADVYLVSNGVDVFERHGDELISTLRHPGQAALAWVVDLGVIVEELETAIAA